MVKRLNENQLRHFYLNYQEQEKTTYLYMSIFSLILCILSLIAIFWLGNYSGWWILIGFILFVTFIISGLCRLFNYFNVKEEIEVNKF